MKNQKQIIQEIMDINLHEPRSYDLVETFLGIMGKWKIWPLKDGSTLNKEWVMYYNLFVDYQKQRLETELKLVAKQYVTIDF